MASWARVRENQRMANWQRLEEAARGVLANAHCPYSGFPVGAAVETASGEIFAGANVENRSFPLSACAERSAVQAAVSAGHKRLAAAVVLTDHSPPSPPCGACRQVLAEFADDLPIRLVNLKGETVDQTLAELLPARFELPS